MDRVLGWRPKLLRTQTDFRHSGHRRAAAQRTTRVLFRKPPGLVSRWRAPLISRCARCESGPRRELRLVGINPGYGHGRPNWWLRIVAPEQAGGNGAQSAHGRIWRRAQRVDSAFHCFFRFVRKCGTERKLMASEYRFTVPHSGAFTAGDLGDRK